MRGDLSVLERLAAVLVHFEIRFEMMPGTGDAHISEAMDDFQAEPSGDTSGA